MERWLFVYWLLVDGYLGDLEGLFFLLDGDKRLEELLNNLLHLRLLLGFRFGRFCQLYLGNRLGSFLILLYDDLVDLIIDEDGMLRLVQLCKSGLRQVRLGIDHNKLWIFLALQYLADHCQLTDDLRLFAVIFLLFLMLDFLLAKDWEVEVVLSCIKLVEDAIFP